MRRLVMILTMCMLPRLAHADSWTMADTALELTFFATLAADYKQTTDIIHRPVLSGHRESNPMIRATHESGLPVATYFVGVGLIHAGVMAVLPRPYRRAVQGLSIGFQVGCITHNWNAGYSLSF